MELTLEVFDVGTPAAPFATTATALFSDMNAVLTQAVSTNPTGDPVFTGFMTLGILPGYVEAGGSRLFGLKNNDDRIDFSATATVPSYVKNRSTTRRTPRRVFVAPLRRAENRSGKSCQHLMLPLAAPEAHENIGLVLPLSRSVSLSIMISYVMPTPTASPTRYLMHPRPYPGAIGPKNDSRSHDLASKARLGSPFLDPVSSEDDTGTGHWPRTRGHGRAGSSSGGRPTGGMAGARTVPPEPTRPAIPFRLATPT